MPTNEFIHEPFNPQLLVTINKSAHPFQVGGFLYTTIS